MKQRKVLWIDLRAGSDECAVPNALRDRFDVQQVCGASSLHGSDHLQCEIARHDPLCVFYDCDYVDRSRVALIRQTKSQNPQVPFVVVALQHSESLAVWAFRQGALDYFVKPVPANELDNCISRLCRIAECRRSPQPRRSLLEAAEIPKSVGRSNAVTRDRLAPAVFYVQQHYHGRIYSDAVARLCGLSPTYFSKAFHQRFGMVFQEFLLRFRIAKACGMLESPGASITDTAYAVGFRDPSYFTRVFRRYIGVTPSEYCQPGVVHGQLPGLCNLLEDSSTSSSQVVRALAGSFA